MNPKTNKSKGFAPKRADGAVERCRELSSLEGHPLQVLTKENEALAEQLERMWSLLEEVSPGEVPDMTAGSAGEALDVTAGSAGEQAVSSAAFPAGEAPAISPDDILAGLEKVRQVTIHYAKKGDLIYPLLKTKYGYKGPSDGLWTADDEIRDDLKKLAEQARKEPETVFAKEWKNDLAGVLERVRDMMVRENNVVFPLCARVFTDDEWKGIARDIQDYETCLIPRQPVWAEAAEKPAAASAAGKNEEVVFPTGHMTAEQLDAMLNTIPMELTFIDENSINRYFNDGPGTKLFKRPLAALDREVFSCHPPKIEPMVRRIIDEFRSGARDSVEIWNTRDGEPVMIRYMAVRNKEGKYLGTLECVQKMGFAKKKGYF